MDRRRIRPRALSGSAPLDGPVEDPVENLVEDPDVATLTTTTVGDDDDDDRIVCRPRAQAGRATAGALGRALTARMRWNRSPTRNWS